MALFALRWEGVLPGSPTVTVSLGADFTLLGLGLAEGDGAHPGALPAGLEETPAAENLRRFAARCAAPRVAAGCASQTDRHAITSARLRRLAAAWRRARPCEPLLHSPGRPAAALAAQRQRHRPRLFVDHVGCHVVEVSWAALGLDEDSLLGFEVELLRPRGALSRPASAPSVGRGGRQGRSPMAASDLRRSSATEDQELLDAGLTSLGRTLVPGGAGAQSYRLRRLRPLQWHRVRVRALGPARTWASAWSEQAPFKTLSVEAARAAGYAFSADALFAPSERRLRAAMGCAEGPAFLGKEGETDEEGDDAPPLHDSEVLLAGLAAAFGASGDEVVKDLLDARHCKDGWQKFSNFGLKHGRPPGTHEARLRRTRLALTASELFGPGLADGNPWSMGPFYYGGRAHHIGNAPARVSTWWRAP